jgi:hypothetical protein
MSKRSLVDNKGQFKEDSIKNLDDVKKWNIKRIKAYKNRLNKYLSYLKNPDCVSEMINCSDITININQIQKNVEYLERYITSLKMIIREKEDVKD